MNPMFLFVFSFDHRDFFVGEMKLGSADISFHLFRVASADDRDRDGWISKHPVDRNLTGRTSMAFANFM